MLRTFSKKLFLTLNLGLACAFSDVSVGTANAQDALPRDNGIYTYHVQPEWRESEGHPLRIAAYIVHPIGWVLREVVARPLSYFASSTETTRSVMGYRYPFDYRNPECFSADGAIPDCRSISPYLGRDGGMNQDGGPQVYFPNVNFDFDKRSLNATGKSMAMKIADTLSKEASLRVVLQGHADYIGTEQYNDVLGLDRAKAVREELIALGVSPERLSTVSFGETMPLIDEQTSEARKANRRVEVHSDKQAPQIMSN
jgi:hypothetical protein